MADSQRMVAEPIRSLASGSIVAGYTAIGGTLDHKLRILHVQNLTDALLMFSFNGDDDHFVLPAQGFMLLDVTANEVGARGLYISTETALFVKRIGTPTTGTVYVSAFHSQITTQ